MGEKPKTMVLQNPRKYFKKEGVVNHGYCHRETKPGENGEFTIGFGIAWF